MSKNTLKRRLKEYNLEKHDNVPVELLHTIIQREVRGPAASFGYCKIQRHLRSRYKLNIPRDNVMNFLREVVQKERRFVDHVNFAVESTSPQVQITSGTRMDMIN